MQRISLWNGYITYSKVCDISSRKVLKNELDARWKTLTEKKKQAQEALQTK